MQTQLLKNRKNKKRAFLKNTLQLLLLIVSAIVLAVILRVFFMASFKIPTPSMEPAIMAGDHIVVDKTVPGARIFKNFDFLENNSRLGIYRFPGRRKVKRNDVLVFNFPYSDWNKLALDMNVYYVKRCAALPGDTFYIENGIYKIKGRSDTIGYYYNQQKLSQKKDFSKDACRCFPFDKGGDADWNMKDFGPLYVPRQGDTIRLDAHAYKVYRKLIEYETGRKLSVEHSRCLLGGSPVTDYVFKTSYYFMAGDLVFDSQDSRYWGLLPEDHIVGKAAFIWKSADMHTGKQRWNRVLKRVR